MKLITFILSLSLGLASPAFANQYLDIPVHEILSDGKILHKEVHYQKESPLYADKYDFIHRNQIIAIDYVVLHEKDFYNCSISSKEVPFLKIPELHLVECRLMKQNATYDYWKD